MDCLLSLSYLIRFKDRLNAGQNAVISSVISAPPPVMFTVHTPLLINVRVLFLQLCLTHFNDSFLCRYPQHTVGSVQVCRCPVAAVSPLRDGPLLPPDLCIIRSWEGNCVKIIQFGRDHYYKSQYSASRAVNQNFTMPGECL